MRESIKDKLPSTFKVVVHTLISILIFTITRGNADYEIIILGNIVIGIQLLNLLLLLSVHLIENYIKE